MAFDRLADAIIKHSKLIIAVWVVILLVAAVPAVKGFGAMSYDIDDMGIEESESMKGFEIIATQFPDSGVDVSSSPMIVLGYDGEDQRERALALAEQLSAAALEGVNGPFVYQTEDGTYQPKLSAIQYQDMPGEDGKGMVMALVMYSQQWDGDVIEDTPVLREQISEVIGEDRDGVGVYLTGSPAISYDMETGALDDISHIDVFTVLMVLILVGLFFRSFITSATPPITIGVAFAVTMALMFGISQFLNIFFITEMMLLVSMMGAGCDYCIFIIARYREELRDGKDHHDALHSAIKWAGESISISAASVIIGFGAMSICSFSMVSVMGICLAIGIIVALFAALTLIPSILAVVGDRIFWPTRIKEYREGGKATKGWFAWSSRVGHKYFDKSSRFTLKHAKAITVVAVLVSLPAAYVALTSETSYDMTGSMMTGESGEGMDYIADYADQGVIYPNYVIMQYDRPVGSVTVTAVTDANGDPMYDANGDQIYNYELKWTGDWKSTYAGSLDELVERIQSGDDNIASVSDVYMWDETVASAKAAGIEVPSILEIISNPSIEAIEAAGHSAQQLLAYAIQNSQGTTKMVLAEAIPQMEQMVLEMAQANPVYGQMISQVVASLNEEQRALLSAYLVATTCGAALDYQVNSNLGVIGGSFASSEDGNGDVTYVKISASTHDAAMSQRSMDSIAYMQGVVRDYDSQNDFVAATWVTGSAVIMYDVSNIISDEFTHIEILVIVLIIILLFFVMRSYTIPFRSVITILMSICWTLAATHLLFGDQVTWLIPLILLVICLGLGMDYDILLTTRIKENVKAHGMTNDEAIHHAVVHSGSVITICGLIMGGAFGTLMLSSMGMLQQFGFALCFAILCDALIVRTYIVPAVMHLLGDWNWKGPRFLERIGAPKAQDKQ